jgi:hypothetical protein
MDLTPYVAELREQLATAAEPGGPQAVAAAERLGAALESSYRLALLDALALATAEITRELAPGSVEVRLRGREVELVVVPPVHPTPAYDEPAPLPVDDSAMTRINLRLGQDLKDRVEDAARGAGLSVNAWLVRAATSALAGGPSPSATPRRRGPGGDHLSGWVR